MNAEPGQTDDALKARIEAAQRRLTEAADLGSDAEQRAEAEIKALETDLERRQAEAEAALEKLRLGHEEELQRVRAAKDQALATAEERLGEIEAQADAAEERIAAAERRAEESERSLAAERARTREAAAGWLRAQLDAIRREAEGR
jgi:colicin import membrane protein